MSRDFTGSPNHLLVSTAPATTTVAVLTMACWVRPDNFDTIHKVPMGICHEQSGQGIVVGDGWQLLLVQDTGVVSANVVGNHNFFGSTSAAVSTGVWSHIGAVYASSTSRLAYTNGVAGTPETTAQPNFANTPNRVSIGTFWFKRDPSWFFDGLIADAAIWNAALTADEMAALARGVSPLTVRPQSLVCYWPLWGLHSPEIDLHPRSSHATNFAATISGTVPQGASNPPVGLFSRRLWLPNSAEPQVVGGGGFQAAWATGSNVILQPGGLAL